MNLLQQYDRNCLCENSILIGIDEAGRGCLAGPVVAGACVLERAFFDSPQALKQSAWINDSKQLSAAARDKQYGLIDSLRTQGLLDVAVASASVEEIAELNILGATRLAMQRAVEAIAARARGWTLPESHIEGPLFQADLSVKILVDGRPLKPFPYAHKGVVRGDGQSLAIAMASIAAKVFRDREMGELSKIYPEYGFDQHKGYGTAAHRAILKKQGPTPVHRALFLRNLL